MHFLLKTKGFKPRRGTVKKCKLCSMSFYAGPCHNKKIFCSMKHMVEWMKKKAFRKNCEICGKIFFCQPCQIKYRNRKTCSMDCRGKMQTKIAEQRRRNNPPTKHALDRRIRYSKKMDIWRKAVFERDNYTCQICRVRGKYLEADHIKPFAYFPELRFELTNGRTLCRKCHDKTKISAKKMQEIWKEEINKFTNIKKESLGFAEQVF